MTKIFHIAKPLPYETEVRLPDENGYWYYYCEECSWMRGFHYLNQKKPITIDPGEDQENVVHKTGIEIDPTGSK